MIALRDVDTSTACADVGSRSLDGQKAHLMVCEPCWIRSMKLLALVLDQIEERRWTRSAGLPLDTHRPRSRGCHA